MFFQANKLAGKMPSMMRLWYLTRGDKEITVFYTFLYTTLFARKKKNLDCM